MLSQGTADTTSLLHTPSTGALGRGHMQLASLRDQQWGEDCLSLILGNQIWDLILTVHLAEIGQWYTASMRMMLLLSPPAQQGSGPGFQWPCSFAEARGSKGELRQLLQDYPSKAGRGGQARGFQRGRQFCSKRSWKPAHPRDWRCSRSKGAPDPNRGKTLTDLPCWQRCPREYTAAHEQNWWVEHILHKHNGFLLFFYFMIS